MKGQITILFVSLWGILIIPLFRLLHATQAHQHLHRFLELITLGSHLAWFAPVVYLTYWIGVGKEIYEPEIIVYVRQPIGWLLPIVFWFLSLNIATWGFRQLMKMHSNHRFQAIGGPRPPQPEA